VAKCNLGDLGSEIALCPERDLDHEVATSAPKILVSEATLLKKFGLGV